MNAPTATRHLLPDLCLREVPAALLEIDKNAVIRAQVPTAIALLIVNVFLLNFLMFR